MSETDEATAADHRVTAPMQSFGSREVTLGLVVLAVGLMLAFVLPLAV